MLSHFSSLDHCQMLIREVRFAWLSFAAALYYSTPPYDNLFFIGAIANSRPSDIFHTGFSLNPTVNIHPEVKIVV